jgi:hypothetical protein
MESSQTPIQFGFIPTQQVGVQVQPINIVHPFVPVDPGQNLPMESTRSGNVFQDRFNPQLSWYLPGYQLAADIDASFSFAAVEQAIDTGGNPSYLATLTLTLSKIEPPDVTAYRTSNPSLTLQEIPLTGLSVALTTTASDPQSGQVQQSVYTAVLAADANGNLAVKFNTLLGTQVLVAYYDLQSGGATLTVAAQFEVWRMQRFFRPIIYRPPLAGGGATILPVSHPMEEARVAPVETPMFWTPVQPVVVQPSRPPIFFQPRPFPPQQPQPPIFIQPRPFPPDPPLPPQPPQPQPVYSIAVDAFSVTVDLAQKFAAPGYARSFTITDPNGERPILGINDLKNFNQRQSEFSEFTALGDIPSQYPSFSRLYIGALSRTIVAIPAVYGIVRSKDGTAVQCQAKFDSTAGGSGAATFQFAFALGPVVSPCEQFALQTALASNPQSQGFTWALPQRLDTSQPATLSTPFQSSVAYTAGPTQNTFGLAVDIVDGGTAGSAVASANLLLKQLSTAVEPFLSGSFGIALDDGYPHPVMANVVVNFSETSGSDEISYTVAVDGSAIELINVSPLDLQVERYEIINGSSALPETLNQELLSGQTLALSDKAPSPAVSLLVDRTLVLESPFTKSALQRYVTFITEDQQAVNYQISVVANGVNFTAMGIAEIGLIITIPSLPQVSIPSSFLTQGSVMSNAIISLPLQNAIGSLLGVISFTVKSAVANQPDVSFTASNDFVDQPTYVLQSSSIPPFVTNAPQQ